MSVRINKQKKSISLFSSIACSSLCLMVLNEFISCNVIAIQSGNAV